MSVPRNRPRKVLGPGSNNPALQGGRKAQIQARDGPNKQEVLSRYLDLVEVALLKQIWLKSTAFFRALDDIKGLQSLVAVASAKLCTLRTSLRAADEGIALSAMKIPQLYRRRTNEKALCSLLQHTQQVLQGKMAIEELLGLEDYVGALQVVSATRSIYSEHLAALAALRAIGSQLEEYSGMICDVMCNKFVNACVSWDVDESVDLHGLSDASNGTLIVLSVRPSFLVFYRLTASITRHLLGPFARIVFLEPKGLPGFLRRWVDPERAGAARVCAHLRGQAAGRASALQVAAVRSHSTDRAHLR